MGGMKFEYDEQGSTFFVFLLSFMALVLIPATYYLWPRDNQKDDQDNKRPCNCEPCQRKKQRLRYRQPWDVWKRRLLKIILLIGWVFLALCAYKVSTIEIDHTEYDPYSILQVDRGASVSEIKRAYRKLSMVYHPDNKETGSDEKFRSIARAHAALTNEESRKNWELYGNPDGPGVTRFGIALPKWIVEEGNSIWVLGLYLFLFLIVLPVSVGTWWYRSIKFTSELILLDTSQLYYYFFHRTPNMVLKRVIMILTASFEFDKVHNSEIVERPSDNEETPMLLKELPHVQMKIRERPFCFPHAVKARALVHSHLSRLDLPPNTLELDRQLILKKCPYLLAEMVNIVASLVAMALAGRAQFLPRLETLENCIKCSQMIVQALWDNKSPLLQLPHISEDMLRHFHTKRRNIRGIKEFVRLPADERRALLRNLSESDYKDVMTVCSMMPQINAEINLEVVDEEDDRITAGSIVTVTVFLTRAGLLESIDGSQNELDEPDTTDVPDADNIADDTETTCADDQPQKAAKKSSNAPKPWEKKHKKQQRGRQQRKRGGASFTSTNNIPSSSAVNKPAAKTDLDKGAVLPSEKPGSDAVIPSVPAAVEESSGSESDIDTEDPKIEDVDSKKNDPDADDDEDDWQRFQADCKRENSLDTKVKVSHPVHCPYFPLEKQEAWWVFVADKKNHQLITAPYQVCSLREEEEVQLKFSAPLKPGSYQYSVCIRSDSYIEFDLIQNLKFEVHPAITVTTHPQWDNVSEEEDEDRDSGAESDTESESD